MLSGLSFIAGDEGHLEEAESLAREAADDGPAAGVPQALWRLSHAGVCLRNGGTWLRPNPSSRVLFLSDESYLV